MIAPEEKKPGRAGRNLPAAPDSWWIFDRFDVVRTETERVRERAVRARVCAA